MAKREAERGWISLGRSRRKLRRFHADLIDSREYMSRLSMFSKANTHFSFIGALHDEGRNRADLWLENNFHLSGARSSCSLEQILV